MPSGLSVFFPICLSFRSIELGFFLIGTTDSLGSCISQLEHSSSSAFHMISRIRTHLLTFAQRASLTRFPHLLGHRSVSFSVPHFSSLLRSRLHYMSRTKLTFMAPERPASTNLLAAARLYGATLMVTLKRWRRIGQLSVRNRPLRANTDAVRPRY